ncbi:hypothetical protein OHA19_01735 [Streptomyces sp. NBC_00012]|uniref:hypothetical protein n=1 Tax=Streptomyces sp. NBC_00012 TaxID=2975621 RepID=UPI00324E4BDE
MSVRVPSKVCVGAAAAAGSAKASSVTVLTAAGQVGGGQHRPGHGAAAGERIAGYGGRGVRGSRRQRRERHEDQSQYEESQRGTTAPGVQEGHGELLGNAKG